MSQHAATTANLVGIHYRVGRKIGEGSFGVIFEGLSLIISSKQCSPRFLLVCRVLVLQGPTFSTPRPLPSNLYACSQHPLLDTLDSIALSRNPARQKRLSSVMNVGRIVFSLAAVRFCSFYLSPSCDISAHIAKYSWYSTDLSLWPGGAAQYSCDRPPWSEFRGSIRYVWT